MYNLFSNMSFINCKISQKHTNSKNMYFNFIKKKVFCSKI
jgi:hypothetical protein